MLLKNQIDSNANQMFSYGQQFLHGPKEVKSVCTLNVLRTYCGCHWNDNFLPVRPKVLPHEQDDCNPNEYWYEHPVNDQHENPYSVAVLVLENLVKRMLKFKALIEKGEADMLPLSICLLIIWIVSATYFKHANFVAMILQKDTHTPAIWKFIEIFWKIWL